MIRTGTLLPASLLLALTILVAGPSQAQPALGFSLLESEPLDLQLLESTLGQLKDAPALRLEGLPQASAAPNANTNFSAVGKSFNTFDFKEDDVAGCRIDPASPAIGANVPLTYFGVPGPTANPSLVGAVQLLTSGPLNTNNQTLTVPLYKGIIRSTGQEVWYIATDSTDQVNAEALGINHSAKLAFADTGRGAREAYLVGTRLEFEQGSVDFTPQRRVVAGAEPTPFPPAEFQPGSVGDEYYSPLAKIVNAGGHIYNLPVVAIGPVSQLRRDDGRPNYDYVHDSVARINPFAGTVTLGLASGFSFGRPVLYLSTDTNDPLAAALEAATFAPGLQDIEVGNDDSLFSAVERLFAFTNGARGCENPHRQGFESAVTDNESPFQILGGIPTIAADYSPLWDVNIAEWTQEAIDLGYRARLIDEFQYLSFVDFGFLTGPGGTEFGSSGIIVNCPIVFRFL